MNEGVSESAKVPATPAGWYPDPEQVQTQRYWDGAAWTEQRAPLPPPPAASNSRVDVELTQRLILGVLGAIIAIVGVFLPHAESASLLHIANNTLLQSGDGIFVIVLAVAGAAAAIRDRATPSVAWALLLLGLVTAALGYYYGTSGQLALENGLGQRLEGTAGAGVWAVGVGGVLMALAGLIKPKASVATPPSASD